MIREEKILEMIKEKPKEHKLNEGVVIKKNMFQIGG